MFAKLDKKELSFIYNKYMVNDFPPDELKPLSHIERMMDQNLCTAHAMKSGDQVLSYFTLCRHSGVALVDYLAINPEYRGQGLGSKTLAHLKEVAAGDTVLVECENPDFAPSQEERTIRQRRINFYLAAGFCLSGVRSKLFDVEYVILTYPKSDSADKGLSDIYKQMLSDAAFKTKLEIY